METLSIHDAQSRLPELVIKAEAGETVVLTRNGAPVAEIGPLHRPAAEAMEHGAEVSRSFFSALLDRIAARAAAQPNAGAEAMRLLREMREDAP